MHTTGDGGAIPQVRRSTYPHAYVHVHATGKAEYVLKCELSTMQKAMYRMIQGQGLCSVGAGGQIRISGLNNVEMQLRKVRSHPYLHFNRGPSPDPTPHPHPNPNPNPNPDPDLALTSLILRCATTRTSTSTRISTRRHAPPLQSTSTARRASLSFSTGYCRSCRSWATGYSRYPNPHLDLTLSSPGPLTVTVIGCCRSCRSWASGYSPSPRWSSC